MKYTINLPTSEPTYTDSGIMGEMSNHHDLLIKPRVFKQFKIVASISINEFV